MEKWISGMLIVTATIFLFAEPGDILITTLDETNGYVAGATVEIYMTPDDTQTPQDERITTPALCTSLPVSPVVTKTGNANENFVRFVKNEDFTSVPDPSASQIPNNALLTFKYIRDGYILQCDDNGGSGYIYDQSCNPDTEDCSLNANEKTVNFIFSVRIEVIKRIDDGNIGIATADPTTGATADLTNVRFYDIIGDTGNGIIPTDDNASVVYNAPRLCTQNHISRRGDDCTGSPKFLVPVPFGQGATKTFRIFVAGYQRQQASLNFTASFGQTKVIVKFDTTCTPDPTTGCGAPLNFSTTLNKIETELGGLIGIASTDPATGHVSGTTTTNFINIETDALNGKAYLDNTNKVWLLPITSNFFTPSRSINIRIDGFAESGNVTFPNSFLFPTPDTTIIYQIDDTCTVNMCSTPLKYAGRIRVANIENNNITPSSLNINLSSTNTYGSLNALLLNGEIQYGQCSEDSPGTANCVYIPVKGYLGSNTTFNTLLTIDGFTQATYSFSGTTTFTQQNFSTSVTPPFFAVKIDKAKDEIGKGFKISGSCPASVAPCNGDITSSTLTISGNPSGDFSIVKTLIQTGKVLIAISGTKKLHETGGTIEVGGKITTKINGFVGSDSNFNGVITPSFNLNLTSQIDLQFGINGCTPSGTVVCAEAHKYKFKFTKLFAKALPNCTPDPQDVSAQIKNIPSSSFSLSSSLFLNGSLQTNPSTDNFYYLPLVDDNNSGTEEILSIGKNTGILLDVCEKNDILYAGVDINISLAYTLTNVSKQFEIQIAPSGSCNGVNTICTDSFLVFNSLKIVTRDETAGKITGVKVSIYKSQTGGLCASLPSNAKVVEDGTESDFDGAKNGEILSISPGFSNTDKLTFVIEKDGYVKRCDDNNGAGYSFNIGSDASGCSDPNAHGTDNCFFEYLQFNVVVNLIKRSDDKKIGFLEPDPESGAVIDTSNTKIFDIEGDTGDGLNITADGDIETENMSRFCSGDNTTPVNNIGMDCSTTKRILIPLLPTTKKFRLKIAGYAEREIDLSSEGNIGTQQISLAFSDNSIDCSGITCVSALQTSVVIDRIEDELGNIIGIGSAGNLGSISSTSNTTFADLATQFNGTPYLITNKWYIPSLSNFENNSFKMVIAGFTEVSSGTLEATTFTTNNPQKTLRFVKDTSNTSICPANSPSIQCVSAPKFAALIRINNIEDTLKPTDISYTLDTNNTFIKVIKNGVTLGTTDFNINNKGTFSKCPGESGTTTNCLYLPVISFLGQNQTMNVELTIDGFTKSSYNFGATATFTQQEPASNSGPILFSIKIEKVKDELDKFFKIGGVCNFNPNCNNTDITTSLITITPTLTGGPAGNFTLLKTYIANGKLFVALKGTRTISEQESSPPTITGKVKLDINGFLGSNSSGIEIGNITLSNTIQKELKFGFSDTDAGECPASNPQIIYCSNLKFKYKLKVTKIVAQDNINPGALQDVTSQMNNLLGKVFVGYGVSLNGIVLVSDVLYIAMYDTDPALAGEILILGEPEVTFTLNNKTTSYSRLSINVSQLFFTSNLNKQFTLEVAPLQGSVSCSSITSSTFVCANKFFTVAKLSLSNLQIITPADGRGFGSTLFKFRFTYKDADGGLPTATTFTLDTDLSLSISAGDLIKEKPCTLIAVDPNDNDTTDGKDYFCEIILFFVPDGISNRGYNRGRFILKASSGNFSATAISGLNQIVTVLDNPPQLTEPTIAPTVGTIGTTFELKVKYKDIENHPPSFIEVLADLNGNNNIETNEVIRMTKVNINDDGYGTVGVMYHAFLTITMVPADQKLRYAYRAGDGFVDDRENTIQTLLPAGFKNNNITNGEFLEVSVVSEALLPNFNWLNINGFEEDMAGLGFVSPDSGTSGNQFTFLVVYSSASNIPAEFVRILYTDRYGARKIPLQQLTQNSLSKLPAYIKNSVENLTTLFDNKFDNGELYFAVVPLFNPDPIEKGVIITGIEISDGNFVRSRNDFRSVVKLTVVDGDNDGIDDAQEGVASATTPTVTSLNALDDPPSSDPAKLYTFEVSPNAVFAPPPDNPRFTSITAPGNLEEGILGTGKLPVPPDPAIEDQTLKLKGLFQLGVRLISGDRVTFTVRLPYTLPIGAKIYKLGSGNIWYDITGSINLSGDRRVFTYDVDNNSNFDRDSDFFGSNDPGGFKFIVDPIGIFVPQFPSDGGGVGGGGGGGCFIHFPHLYNYNDPILSFFFLLLTATLIFRKIYKYLFYRSI